MSKYISIVILILIAVVCFTFILREDSLKSNADEIQQTNLKQTVERKIP